MTILNEDYYHFKWWRWRTCLETNKLLLSILPIRTAVSFIKLCYNISFCLTYIFLLLWMPYGRWNILVTTKLSSRVKHCFNVPSTTFKRFERQKIRYGCCMDVERTLCINLVPFKLEALFWRPFDVILTSWMSDGHWNNVLCLWADFPQIWDIVLTLFEH